MDSDPTGQCAGANHLHSSTSRKPASALNVPSRTKFGPFGQPAGDGYASQAAQASMAELRKPALWLVESQIQRSFFVSWALT
jgi:hypothetical protein